MTTGTETAPQSAKELVRAALESLPDDTTLDEVFVQEKIRQSLQNSKGGRSFTTDEVRALLAKWRESDG